MNVKSKIKYFVLICLVVLLGWQGYEFLRKQSLLMGVDMWGYLCIIISDALLRVITLILIAALGMQTVVLYLITKANHNPSEIQSNSSEQSRGRGRPRKPCVLATTGLVECPFAPDVFEPPPKLVQRIAERLRTETPEELAKRLEQRLREEKKPKHEEPKKELVKAEKPKQNKKRDSIVVGFLREAIKEKDEK